MENHAWRSASPGRSSSEDDADRPIGINNTTGSRHVHSHATLEILQAHLDADAESDSSEASGPRVHPDFFVHLENLRRVNEANRVNARREAETWYHEHMPMAGHPPHAPRVITMENHDQQNPRFVQYEIYPIVAGPSQPMPPHVRFETPDSAAHVSTWEHSHHHRPPSPYPTADPASHAHTRDRFPHRRPPSPYPTVGRGQRSTFRNYAPTSSTFRNYAATSSTPRPQEYTEHGNPYRIPFEQAPFPEGATPYDQDRLLQAWLVRQQLIAGVRPEDIQPMGQSSGRRHRTPPYIVLNDSGAHIIRMESASFDGAMLPLPALPWLPRRPNNSSNTAPVSSNTHDGSGLPTGPSTNITTAPDSVNTLNSPVLQNLLAVTNPPVGSHLPAAVTNLPVGPNLPAAVMNLPIGSHLPAAVMVSPVGSNLPAVTNLPVGSHLPVAATNLPVGSHLQADATNLPVGSDLQAATTLLAAPALPADYDVVSGPTFAPEQQNNTDSDSISSQESSGTEVSPAHSQGSDSLTPSPSSTEGSEAGYVSSP